MVYGHAAHTDLPDGGTGKTCLGGGMYCPRASSLCYKCPKCCADVFIVHFVNVFRLQCFDTVGLASGRASSL